MGRPFPPRATRPHFLHVTMNGNGEGFRRESNPPVRFCASSQPPRCISHPSRETQVSVGDFITPTPPCGRRTATPARLHDRRRSGKAAVRESDPERHRCPSALSERGSSKRRGPSGGLMRFTMKSCPRIRPQFARALARLSRLTSFRAASRGWQLLAPGYAVAPACRDSRPCGYKTRRKKFPKTPCSFAADRGVTIG